MVYRVGERVVGYLYELNTQIRAENVKQTPVDNNTRLTI